MSSSYHVNKGNGPGGDISAGIPPASLGLSSGKPNAQKQLNRDAKSQTNIRGQFQKGLSKMTMSNDSNSQSPARQNLSLLAMSGPQGSTEKRSQHSPCKHRPKAWQLQRFVSEYKEQNTNAGFIVRGMAPAQIIAANMQLSQMNIVTDDHACDKEEQTASEAGSRKIASSMLKPNQNQGQNRERPKDLPARVSIETASDDKSSQNQYSPNRSQQQFQTQPARQVKFKDQESLFKVINQPVRGLPKILNAEGNSMQYYKKKNNQNNKVIQAQRLLEYRQSLFDDRIQNSFQTNLLQNRDAKQRVGAKSAGRAYRPNKIRTQTKDPKKRECADIVNKYMKIINKDPYHKNKCIIDIDDLEEDMQQTNKSYRSKQLADQQRRLSLLEKQEPKEMGQEASGNHKADGNAAGAAKPTKETKAEIARRNKELLRKVNQQIDFHINMPHYNPNKYRQLKQQKQQRLQNEFLWKYRSKLDRNGQIKAPVDRNSESEGSDGEEDEHKQMAKSEALEVKDSYAERQSKFFARFMPETADYNQHKMDKLFQVHQMEALRDLKTRYDSIANILDTKDCSQQYKLDLIKDLHEVQSAYQSFDYQYKYLNDLIDHNTYKDQKETEKGGHAKQGASAVSDKIENTDLKILLNDTSQMNAVISAGQFNMHKKDVNGRMCSLAFKMEKVYNLDQKKGPAAEVYRYFMRTFDGIFE